MTVLEELQRQISTHCSAATTATAIPGLSLHRCCVANTTPTQVIYTPMLFVIAQGRKEVVLAGETFRYDAESYLITSVDLPVRAAICRASPEQPYLALSLTLDLQLLSEILAELPPAAHRGAVPRGLAVTRVTPELLEALTRLLRLLGEPAGIAFLAPLVQREILYRLLTGPQGTMLQQSAQQGSQTQQVIRALNWLRQHYAEPFRIGELLELTRMSAPSLYRHFKAVAGMSPLQYQKQIRLQEARRMLASQGLDASTAGFAVGYESPSQFSREYTRQFGAPPRRDAQRPSALP